MAAGISPLLSDGQRAQLHVRDGHTVHLYSRSGRDLLRHPGMAWLRDIAWPFVSAILDGEAVAGDGHEGIQAVFTERDRIGGDMAFVAFDVLEGAGGSVMRERWEHRRKRLADLLAGVSLPRVGIVPVTEDATRLYETWIGMGGEGVVLKDRSSIYRPGVRSPAWLKLKPKVTLEAVVTGGSARPIPWGDWSLAVMLELRYPHPRTGKPVEIRQAIRIRRDETFELRTSACAELLCCCQRSPHTEPPGSGKLSHPGSPIVSQAGSPILSHPGAAIWSHRVERDRISLSFSSPQGILFGAAPSTPGGDSWRDGGVR